MSLSQIHSLISSRFFEIWLHCGIHHSKQQLSLMTDVFEKMT